MTKEKLDEIINNILAVYKKLPYYLNTPTKKPQWYQKASKMGKNSFEKIKEYLSKKL